MMDADQPYNDGQLKGIVPFLGGAKPRWMVLGGPADGNEAQTARKLWPDINIIGIEPNPEAWEWQLANGWPKGQPLLLAALGESRREVDVPMRLGALRSASLDPVRVPEIHEIVRTQVMTVDELDSRFGPFADAVLWLDVEGYELPALLGAAACLARKAFNLVSVELLPRLPDEKARVFELFATNGYHHAGNWTEVDYVFVKK